MTGTGDQIESSQAVPPTLTATEGFELSNSCLILATPFASSTIAKSQGQVDSVPSDGVQVEELSTGR